MNEPIFYRDILTEDEKQQLNCDGHLALEGLLTEEVRPRLVQSLAAVQAAPETPQKRPSGLAAEFDEYLATLIAHPQMLSLAREVLGNDIRFDHCVTLVRPAGNHGLGWHSHSYADTRPELGFLRIFFYINGFTSDDAGLKVVPGSHLFRDGRLKAATDEELRVGWMAGKRHPLTGEPLKIQHLTAPPGTVILMWTHAAHAVTPRQEGSPTRWTVVYAYRNPGEPSHARWMSEEFERNPPRGTEDLMSLY